MPIISFAPGSKVTFGRSLMLISDSHFSEPGVSHPVVLRTLTPVAFLSVGDQVGMSGSSVCAAESVKIGNDCLLGADVLITDTDFHSTTAKGPRLHQKNAKTAPVVVGDNVFIGARSIVLKGVTIGDHAVIGAGSVVTEDVPERAVVAGVPARVVGWSQR
jgi:acetyltransferase-like isoleucine patch superfamily enzyme